MNDKKLNNLKNAKKLKNKLEHYNIFAYLQQTVMSFCDFLFLQVLDMLDVLQFILFPRFFGGVIF